MARSQRPVNGEEPSFFDAAGRSPSASVSTKQSDFISAIVYPTKPLLCISRRSPALDALARLLRDLSLPLQIFQVCQDFEYRETVVERDKGAFPELICYFRGGLGLAFEQPQYTGTAIGVMFDSLADPVAMPRKGCAVRRENQLDFQARQGIQRRQEFAQCIAVLVPADIWGDIFEQLIARKQYAPLAIIE